MDRLSTIPCFFLVEPRGWTRLARKTAWGVKARFTTHVKKGNTERGPLCGRQPGARHLWDLQILTGELPVGRIGSLGSVVIENNSSGRISLPAAVAVAGSTEAFPLSYETPGSRVYTQAQENRRTHTLHQSLVGLVSEKGTLQPILTNRLGSLEICRSRFNVWWLRGCQALS